MAREGEETEEERRGRRKQDSFKCPHPRLEMLDPPLIASLMVTLPMTSCNAKR